MPVILGEPVSVLWLSLLALYSCGASSAMPGSSSLMTTTTTTTSFFKDATLDAVESSLYSKAAGVDQATAEEWEELPDWKNKTFLDAQAVACHRRSNPSLIPRYALHHKHSKMKSDRKDLAKALKK